VGEGRFGIAEDSQRVTGEHPGPDVIGPAFGVLGDFRPNVVGQPGIGERDCGLTGEGTVPGRVDRG